MKYRNTFFYIALSFVLSLVLYSCGDNPVNNEDNTLVLQKTTLDSLNFMIKDDPENQRLYLRRAQEYIRLNKFSEAQNDFDRCKRIDSTFDELYLIRGDFKFNTQKYKEAKEDYEQCIIYNEENKFCLLKKARMELLLGNFEKAIFNINDALRVDQYYAEAYFEKGRYYELLQDTTNAISSYSTAIELDPEYYLAYVQVALIHTGEHNDLALEYYNSALEISPTSVEALLNKALYLQETAYRDSARVEEAMAIYSQVEEIQPYNHIPNYNKGYIYMEYKNELDSASFEFAQVIQKNPASFQSYYNQGLIYERKGLYRDALDQMEISLQIDPTFTLAALAKERILENLSE